MSTAVKKPPRIRAACGTPQGYRVHQRAAEECCEACTDAKASAKANAWRPPSTEDIASEVEWMLHLNQGRHTIITALGYVGREETLRKRLGAHGRHDLVDRMSPNQHFAN